MAGNFFPVDVQVLSTLLTHFRQHHWAHPIVAYIILCKHQQRGEPYTTAGAKAVGKVLGLTRYRAEQVIRELEQAKWGEAPDERAIVNHQILKTHPELGFPHTIGMFPVKALPRLSDDCMWLPNRILEEKDGTPPPMARLNVIQPASARYDALSILLYSYANHDIQGSGGLDPRKTFWSPWRDEGACLEGGGRLGYQGSQKDGGINWFFWLVARPDEILAQKSFIEMTTEGDLVRFSQAVGHLKEQGFYEEVAMVFDRDPIASYSAEPLYPLWSFDALYRENAKALRTGTGGLYSETFNCLDRSGHMEATVGQFRYQTFAPYGIAREPSGFYAVAAQVNTAKVISVFRLRFCPNDHDSGLGYQAEANRSSYWKACLSQAFSLRRTCSNYLWESTKRSYFSTSSLQEFKGSNVQEIKEGYSIWSQCPDAYSTIKRDSEGEARRFMMRHKPY